MSSKGIIPGALVILSVIQDADGLSWPTMAEAHLPHDGVAMRINGVGGTDAIVRAWARSISMRPYGEDLDPSPLQDVDARKWVTSTCLSSNLLTSIYILLTLPSFAVHL